MKGTIKRISADKGFGFIRGQDGKDYFFHRSAVKNARFGDLAEGQDVEYEGDVTDTGPRAEDVYVS